MSILFPPPAAAGGGIADLSAAHTDGSNGQVLHSLRTHHAAPFLIGTGLCESPTFAGFSAALESTPQAYGLPVYSIFSTSNSNGVQTYVHSIREFWGQKPIDYYCMFRTDTQADDRQRARLGLYNAVPAGMNIDSVVGNQMGLRWQDGDTNFIFESRGATGLQTTNSGIAIADHLDSVLAIRIRYRPTGSSDRVDFTLYDTDGTILTGPTAHNTQFPNGTSPMHVYAPYIDNDGVADFRDIGIYYCNVVAHYQDPA
jgi:hypothetical protein